MKQLTVNKFLRLFSLQALLALSIFLGACSSLNETLSETDLPQEENLEVATITDDIKVTIKVEEGKKTTSYDSEAFVTKWPWQISFQSQVLGPLINDIVADTNASGDAGCSYNEFGNKKWVLTCEIAGYFCSAYGQGEEIVRFTCA